MDQRKPDKTIDWILRSALLLLIPATVLFINTAVPVDEGKWLIVQLGAPVIAALWMIRASALGRPLLPLDPLSIAMYVGLAGMALSMLPAVNGHMAAIDLSKRFALVCVFILMATAMRARHDRLDAVWVLLGTGFIGTAYGISQHFGYDFFPWADHKYSPTVRGVSFYGHATFAGSFLAIAIPVCVGMVFAAPALWQRAAAFVTASAMIYHLSFSGARGATLAVFAAAVATVLVLVGTMLLRKSGRPAGSRRNVVVASIVVGVALAGGFYLVYRAWAIKDTDFYTMRDMSAMLRLYTWETALRLFLSNPLLGVGTGNYEIVIPMHWNGPEANHFSVHGQIMHQAHNEYLEVAAEQGLIGIAALLATITIALAYAWDAWLHAGSALERRLGLALFAAVIAASVDAAFIFSFQTAASATALWAVFGIIAAQRLDLLSGHAELTEGANHVQNEVGDIVVEDHSGAGDRERVVRAGNENG